MKMGIYLRLKMIEYCVGFFIKNNVVALIEKKRPSWQKGKLNGIGGKIEQNELAYNAMVREFEEEAGVKTKIEDWSLRLSLSGIDEFIVHFFLYTGSVLLEEIKQCTDEEVKLVSLPGLNFCNVINNLKWIIPLIMDEDIKFPLFIEEKVGVNKRYENKSG
jgi:8-oxo-dGTP diphosphatase